MLILELRINKIMQTTLNDLEDCKLIDSYYYCLHNTQIEDISPELLPIRHNNSETIEDSSLELANQERIKKTIEEYIKKPE